MFVLSSAFLEKKEGDTSADKLQLLATQLSHVQCARRTMSGSSRN